MIWCVLLIIQLYQTRTKNRQSFFDDYEDFELSPLTLLSLECYKLLNEWACQMPKHLTVCKTLESCHGCSYFIFCHDCKVNCRNTTFALQSNLPGMCARMYFISQRGALPDDDMLWWDRFRFFSRVPCVGTLAAPTDWLTQDFCLSVSPTLGLGLCTL